MKTGSDFFDYLVAADEYAKADAAVLLAKAQGTNTGHGVNKGKNGQVAIEPLLELVENQKEERVNNVQFHPQKKKTKLYRYQVTTIQPQQVTWA